MQKIKKWCGSRYKQIHKLLYRYFKNCNASQKVFSTTMWTIAFLRNSGKENCISGKGFGSDIHQKYCWRFHKRNQHGHVYRNWKIFLVQRDAGTTNQKQFQPVLNVFGFEYNSMNFELEAEHMLTEIFTKMSFVVKKNANPQIDENPLQNLPKKSNVKKSWKKKLAKNIVLKCKFNVKIWNTSLISDWKLRIKSVKKMQIITQFWLVLFLTELNS